jgi:hypothetical protein
MLAASQASRFNNYQLPQFSYLRGLLVGLSDVTNTKLGINAFNNPLAINTTQVTAIGYNTAQSDSSGNLLVAVGSSALSANTTGSSNTAIGASSLLSNTTGSNNTGIGAGALQGNTSGASNTCVGSAACNTVSTVSQETCIGNSCLKNATGAANTGVGYQALLANTTGTNNVGVGVTAFSTTQATGTKLTGIGYGVSVNADGYTDSCAIGYNAQITASDECVFGDSSLTLVTSTGVFNSGTGFRISGSAAAGHYLRGNGTNYVDNTIQTADVPTLNQNTTGTSGSNRSLLTGLCIGTATSGASTLGLWGLGSGSTGCTGTRQAGQAPIMANAGTASNLSVSCATTGVSSSSGVFTVYDFPSGGAVTPESLTVTYGTTTANTVVVDSTHSFAFNAGDRIGVQYTTQGSETLASCAASVLITQ